MNYTDYRTGTPISREQYIANGIDRGELLYSYDCGCVIIQDSTADAYIVYCPKHDAAPDMYEALKSQHEAIDILFALLIQHVDGFFPSKSGKPWEAMLEGNNAIAKAEGKD